MKYSVRVIKVRLEPFIQPNTKVSLYAIHEETGMSYNTLHKLKSGKTKAIKSDSLDKIITALRKLGDIEVTPCDILEYIPDPPKKSKK